jgi:chemotaxis protein MotB
MAGRKNTKRQVQGTHENQERWLLTYADMITLLVAFFIMLYAMSIMNQTKFQQLAISVRSGFGSSLTNGAPTIISNGGGINGTPSLLSNGQTNQSDPSFNSIRQSAFANLPRTEMDGGETATEDRDRLDQAYVQVQKYIQKHDLAKIMRVSKSMRGVIVTLLTDKTLFASGKADLLPQDLGLLREVAKVLNTLPNDVSVEGHTDNLPIHTGQYPSNWDLSAARATTVLRFLISCQVSEKRLEEAGFGDERPAVPNDNEADRSQNRRVAIVILRLT